MVDGEAHSTPKQLLHLVFGGELTSVAEARLTTVPPLLSVATAMNRVEPRAKPTVEAVSL